MKLELKLQLDLQFFGKKYLCLDLYSAVENSKLFYETAARESLGMPVEKKRSNKKEEVHFPEELVLGPEQIKAIKSTTRSTYLIGEAGSGKTTVVLALLYKFTGKHVNPKKLRKTIFSIPKSKTELKKDVERFIVKYCRTEWTELRDMELFENYGSCLDNIYLFEEMYGSRDARFPIRPGRKMWLAYISTSSDNAADPKAFGFNSSQVIYFSQ